MEIKHLQDAFDLLKKLESESTKVLFRGQANFEWSLIPTIGRNHNILTNEETKLDEFKASILWLPQNIQSQEYFKEFCTNDFSLFAWAQHYDIFPTRFLDWTDKILISLLFACRDLSSCDGCVWMFILPNNDAPCWRIFEKKDNPLFYEELKIFFVPHFIDDWKIKIEDKDFGNRRPEVQSSIMTIHPKNKDGNFMSLEELVETNSLMKIRIPSGSKKYLQQELSDNYYINQNTVLDGKTIQDIKSDKAWERIIKERLKSFC